METRFDLIVIGAGINGAGIARDAAMRGWKVLLFDKGDIGSGTSSASTRLIHGGLRYLEHGDLTLVRQSLNERDVLLRIAPHLVRPLPFLIPIYKSSKRGRLAIRAGLTAYNLLSRKSPLPSHRMLSRQEILARVPGLNPEGLLGGALYFDAQVEFAERLVLENVISACDYRASVRTYVRLKEFLVESNRVCGVELTDQITGESASALAELIVNAAGPWVDEVLSHAGMPSTPLIGGTKGSHIVVPNFEGAPSDALYVEAKQDMRPFFVIPWNHHYLIGTTDSRVAGQLDNVKANSAEVGYLLYETNRLFPKAQLERESVLFSYSGIRPLAHSGERLEGRIARRHWIREHERLSGLFSIVGGKLTTYRHVAEETVDLLQQRLTGKPIAVSTTATTPLPGASALNSNDFFKNFQTDIGVPPQVIERLLRIYGTRAAEVAKLVRRSPALINVFDPETHAIAAEVVFAFENELARTLSDCMLRRTMVGFNSACGLNAVKAAGVVAQEYLGWSHERANSEIVQYEQHVQGYLRSGLSRLELHQRAKSSE